MCQLTILAPSQDNAPLDDLFIPAATEYPTSGVTQRNTFTVKHASQSSATPATRTDIDMRKQRRVITTHRRKALEKAIAKDWMETCATRRDHARFLTMLLAETDRYRRSQLSDAELELEDTVSPLKAMSKRCVKRMLSSSNDQYVACLEEISGKRFFDTGAAPTRRASVRVE